MEAGRRDAVRTFNVQRNYKTVAFLLLYFIFKIINTVTSDSEP
jgi:hypothetical protein